MSKIISNVDLLNKLRLTKTSSFYDRVPEVTQDNLANVLQIMDKFPEMYNEMTGSVIQKIGLQIASDFDDFKNPLEIFKKGDLPFGKTIEEVYMDLYPARAFDQKASETDVLKRVIPDIKTKYHVENREEFYKTTISMKHLRQAFMAEYGIYDYVYSLFTKRLYQSDVYDEYLIMKKIIDDGIAEGVKEDNPVKVFELGYTDDKQFSRNLAKVLRSEPKRLQFYNNSTLSGVDNVTAIENQVIITTPDVEALIDVDVLSSAFHMDKADTEGRLAIIDEFEDSDVLAVIVSKNFMLQYDTYYNLEPDIYNPEGIYRQYFLHHHGLYSMSKFENMIIIKKESDEEVETRSVKEPTRKELLIEEATEKGIDLTGKETIKELEELLKDGE